MVDKRMVILFICTGNTCRSPMAQAFLQKELDDRGIDAKVLSAGLAQPGEPVTPEAAEAMRKLGYDISAHVSDTARPIYMEISDVILCMQLAHKQVVTIGYLGIEKKTCTLKEFVGEEGDVIDPFGGDQAEYDACAAELQALCKKAADIIENGKVNA